MEPNSDKANQQAHDVEHHENIVDQKETATRVDQIQKATRREREMSTSTAFRLYPKAVGWSILLSTTVVMEGYDLLLITSFFAFDSWTKKYGVLQADGTYSVSAAWQSGLYNGAAAGEIIGLLLNGFVAEIFGYRKTMLAALALITGFILIQFFAPTVEILQVGSVLMGIPWGIFQTLPASYASEVCPVALRGLLTTYINICWVMGQLLASGVLRAMLGREDQWSYRIPYALQWVWPVPLMVGIAFAPDSPWWYVRRGNTEGAKSALRSLTVKHADNALDVDIDATVEVMVYTNELEQEASQGATYLDCFRGYNLRRTEIACLTWGVQQICGTTLMNNSTYFFQQAGMDTSNAFNLTMAQYGIGFVGVFLAWSLMIHIGRRQLYLWGLFVLSILLFGIGVTGVIGPNHSAAYWASGALLLVFSFCYQVTVGTVCYSIVSEISSVRLRSKTISLARNGYNVCAIVSGIMTPYMINPTAWNWKAKAGFFWAGSCVLCFVWTFFRLPETKGRTYAELDILFERKVNARKFSTTSVNLFSREVQEEADHRRDIT
ncbi:Major facilitator superfamily domain general substrate transporter [Penicillium soppii]|jgi:SP family general alpha glucoside:H+ symporter-like MFS transporter|uniref:Major facilitator superfamily domain general substrate transporter n=1 Tax=Penicillium soppii TaxID=69789 RepID=UPI00254821EB|nr:Major facilitator superfamily domain general substrate transporter [Penicillium soppii]KAJ5882347.1 Major facilitator superfamily domain general substrate transporter [Penicillium soppii]